MKQERANAVRLDGPHIVQLIFGVFMLRPLLRFSYRVRVHRQERVPAGGVVFAANHRSFFDPPFVAMWLDRPVSFFARANLWKLPVIGTFLRIFGGFPIDRSEPQVAVMKRTVAWLRSGGRVLVFPEGTRTRSGRLGPLRTGAALFARRAGVPVVPVYVHHSELVWRRGSPLPSLWAGTRCGIFYGPALRAPTSLSSKEQDAWLSVRIEAWLQRQERALLGVTNGD